MNKQIINFILFVITEVFIFLISYLTVSFVYGNFSVFELPMDYRFIIVLITFVASIPIVIHFFKDELI